MIAAAEDADIPLHPVASAIWALFAAIAAVPAASAQTFDAASIQVLQAYSPPLDAFKVEAARAGLNLLLPRLLGFSDLLPNPPSGTGSGFGTYGSSDFSFFPGNLGALIGVYSSTFLAASDADLAALGNPVTLSDAVLQVTASFATGRDFFIGPEQARIDTPGTALSISGAIAASATLAKTGSGTLTLSGANVWSAPLVVAEGTLRGSAASLQTAIANDATVEFAQATDATYGYVMTGAGSVRKTGPGTLTLSGANARGGANSIEQGRVALRGAGSLGGGSVSIAAGATLDLSAVDGDRGIGPLSGDGAIVLGDHRLDTVASIDTTFGGTVSGSGLFGKGGAGKLTLTAANSYSGATIVTEGTLALAGAGRLNFQTALRMNAGTTFDIGAADGERSLGSLDGAGTILLGRNSLAVGGDNTDTVFAGALQGEGALIKRGSGTLSLTGATQHTGPTTIAQGTLLVRAHSLGPDVTNNATLAFLETRSAAIPAEAPVPAGTLHALYPELYVYSGSIAGSGLVVKRGSGVLWLRGTNSYSGGTLIEDGILLGNVRSLQGAIVNNAGLAFYQVADGAYAGSTSGSGILLKYGPGNLTLAGVNAHSGGTAFSGPLTVADDRNLGAANAAVIIAGGTLRTTADIASARPFGLGAGGAILDTGNHAVTLSGAISGPGALTKIGSGTLALSGQNSYAGPTYVQAGTLALNGALASPLIVAAGATLAGTGTVAADVTLAPGATLGVRVDAGGNSTRIGAGSAHIDGALLDIEAQAGAYRARTDYTILTAANGVTGRFGQISANLPFLQPRIQYGTHSVGLALLRNDTAYQAVARTRTQVGIATALGALVSSEDADARLAGTMLDGLTASEARSAFDSIGGVGRATAAIMQQSGQRAVTQQAMSRLGMADTAGGAGNAIALSSVQLAFEESTASDARAIYAAALSAAGMGDATASRRHGFWLRGFGGSGRIDGSAGASDASLRFTGLVAGYDQAFGEHDRFGALAAYSKPKLIQDRPQIRSEADSYQLALYGRFRDERLRIDALAGIGAAAIDDRRVVRAGGLTRTTTSSYDARTVSAYVEAGYAFGDRVIVEPILGLEWSRQRNDGHTENGAGAFNLTEQERHVDSLRSSLGARILRRWHGGAMETTLEARAAWAHEFRSPSALSARFAADSTATAFSVPTLEMPRNSAILGAGVSVTSASAVSFYADVSAELSSGQRVHAFGAGMRYRW